MINMIVVLVMSALTIIPIKFVHPIRVRDFRNITIPVLTVWLATLVYLTWIIDDRTRGCATSCLSVPVRIGQGIVYLGAAWIIGVGVWRTVRGEPIGDGARDEIGGHRNEPGAATT